MAQKYIALINSEIVKAIIISAKTINIIRFISTEVEISSSVFADLRYAQLISFTD